MFWELLCLIGFDLYVGCYFVLVSACAMVGLVVFDLVGLGKL